MKPASRSCNAKIARSPRGRSLAKHRTGPHSPRAAHSHGAKSRRVRPAAVHSLHEPRDTGAALWRRPSARGLLQTDISQQTRFLPQWCNSRNGALGGRRKRPQRVDFVGRKHIRPFSPVSFVYPFNVIFSVEPDIDQHGRQNVTAVAPLLLASTWALFDPPLNGRRSTSVKLSIRRKSIAKYCGAQQSTGSLGSNVNRMLVVSGGGSAPTEFGPYPSKPAPSPAAPAARAKSLLVIVVGMRSLASLAIRKATVAAPSGMPWARNVPALLLSRGDQRNGVLPSNLVGPSYVMAHMESAHHSKSI